MTEQKDQVVTELERIVRSSLSIPCEFLHANLRDANFGLDAMQSGQFPVFILVSTGRSRNVVTPSGNIMRKVEIYALMLDRYDAATPDTTSADVNHVIKKMQDLSEQLFYQLNRSPLAAFSDDGEPCGVTGWQADEVYSKFDANLFGQGLTFTWTVSTGRNGYRPS